MLRTLRSRLLLGIAPLLAVMVALGLWAVVMFYRLGGNIDVILRENYRSVLAAQGMKEALERMDSAILFAVGGQEARAREQFRESRPVFEKNLAIERGNITLPGEERMAGDLTTLYARYIELSDRFFALPPSDVEGRTRLYFGRAAARLSSGSRTAPTTCSTSTSGPWSGRTARPGWPPRRRSAGWSWRSIGSTAIATLIALLLSRSILGPIRAVTLAARAMARGDLEQVVPVLSHDELGELADAFNAMARRIREFQQAGTAKLLRAQKTAQATIDSFPDPVVVLDPSGSVERSNPSARRLLGVVPVEGGAAPWKPPDPLGPRLSGVLKGDADYLPTSFEHAIGLREDGQEHYLLPRILAIRDESEGTLGAAVVLTDVTRFRLMDQIKSDMVSTVSHELKTPLTSIQMAVHLLLEEAVGPLNPKQAELLRRGPPGLRPVAGDDQRPAGPDQDRAGPGPARPPPRRGGRAGRAGGRPVRGPGREAGVGLVSDVAPALPPVMVDAQRVGHVFDNLIGNALAHTERGGTIRLTAEADGQAVRLRRAGHRRRDRGRAPAAPVREVLPGAGGAGRRRGRARPGDRPRDRPGPGGRDRRGQPTRTGDHLHFHDADRVGAG